MSNISVLIFIFLFTYALIGLELYAYRLETSVASRFDTFLQAFLSVFIVLANDGWTRIFFEHYRATNSILACVYFLSLIVFGQFILLNLFIAILIENFEQLSVRNDLSNKLNELEREPLSTQIMQLVCFWRPKPDKSNKKSKADELTDEELQNLKLMLDLAEQQTLSMWVFNYQGKIRQTSFAILQHKYFEWAMLLFIVINTI